MYSGGAEVALGEMPAEMRLWESLPQRAADVRLETKLQPITTLNVLQAVALLDPVCAFAFGRYVQGV